MFSKVTQLIPESTKNTLIMRAFGLTRIPLLFMCSPKVQKVTDTRCEVLFPFRKFIKNHLGSVYFGALAIGADTCVGYLAVHKIQVSGRKISLVFKDFKANFLKRAEGDTLFICEGGEIMNELIAEILKTNSRGHRTIPARAEVGGEVVAEFELTISLKPQ